MLKLHIVINFDGDGKSEYILGDTNLSLIPENQDPIVVTPSLSLDALQINSQPFPCNLNAWQTCPAFKNPRVQSEVLGRNLNPSTCYWPTWKNIKIAKNILSLPVSVMSMWRETQRANPLYISWNICLVRFPHPPIHAELFGSSPVLSLTWNGSEIYYVSETFLKRGV